MSGLMLVFLAVAVFFMRQVEAERQDLEEIAVVYDSIKVSLYEELRAELRQDLPNWGAELDPVTLAVRFESPEVLFERGRADLNPRFRDILDSFFPRYIGVLTSEPFRSHVQEVRIEGHTSSDWEDLQGLAAYERNMELSQERTRNVLSYVVRLEGAREHWDGWLRTRLTANGLSSGQPVLQDGAEDPVRSRRVEFRVRTDADERLSEIVQRIAP